MGSSRTIIISEPNLELLGNPFSYGDYDAFYAKHFAPLKVSDPHLLIEPVEVVTESLPKPVALPLRVAGKKQPTRKTEKKPEHKAIDLEDEYYDLEGF